MFMPYSNIRFILKYKDIKAVKLLKKCFNYLFSILHISPNPATGIPSPLISLAQ